MRTIILLLIIAVIAEAAASQASVKKAASSKSEMQSQMDEAANDIKKQIAELEKDLKSETDPEAIKNLKDEIDLLKKQLGMMQGLNKKIGNMSEAVVQQGIHEDSATIPKRDLTRIAVLPKRTLTEAELLSFIKNVHAGVEKIISVAERTEALKIYNETKSKYKSIASVANAASGCWMLGHWEKALFIMGKACIDSAADADNLNNYAAFLIMTGAEQAALPILEYLNEKYPNNSTILNNIGQTWFGLGDMEKANKYLNAATELYPNHSMANNTLSRVYQSQGDTTKAVNFLKASLKENYDPEKEAELSRLGYTIKYSDMPEFNYPMKPDPLGLIPFIESIPEDYPTEIGNDERVNAINSYKLGVKNLTEEMNQEDEKLKSKLKDRIFKLSSDQTFRMDFLEPHNSPAYKLAERSFQLIWAEKMGNSSPLITQLLFSLPVQKPFADIKAVKTVHEVWQQCQDIWAENVAKPIADLARAWKASGDGKTCADIDAATNAYLAKRNEIRKKGIRLIKQKVHENAKELDTWVKIALYSVQDDPPKNEEQLTTDLISELDFTIGRKSYRDGELYYMLNMAQNFVENQAKLRSSCSNQQPPDDDPKADVLAPLIVRNLKCEFKKVLSTPVVVYSFQCNIMKESTKRNLKAKKDPVNRGQGQSSRRANTNSNGPLRGGRGPFVLNDIDQFTNVNQRLAPLTAEDKDLSQSSIEYDSWGNLVGLNVQLNNEGTALADPDSAEIGVDSRWSWNAMGSPKKGFLYKLLLK